MVNCKGSDNININIKYILMAIAFAVLCIVGYFIMPNNDTIEINSENEVQNNIFVHIEGEVNNPGLIEVEYGTRLYELIEKAGGETENADTSRVNLSSILSDEQKVVIPSKVLISSEENQEDQDVLININTASMEKLMKLDGIGEGTAKKIIKYREENGYFNEIEDLKKVSGIGENKFNGLKDDITI